jgi:hypothetical protein
VSDRIASLSRGREVLFRLTYRFGS